MPQSFSRVKETFDAWSMYQAVVDAGYMHHAELVARLAEWAQKQPEPLRIIDLGCGDSGLATQAFAKANVASYRGVDVSDASALAQANIAIWPGRAEVVAGNLADFLHHAADGSSNVILGSYSIHHFSTEAKKDIIRDCYRVLSPGGTLIWIDAVRRDDESHDAYITRLATEMANHWSSLTPDQRDKACTHVRECDFPETASWMLAHLGAAGFIRPAQILARAFFDGWTFTKPQELRRISDLQSES
jgi:ubiquinone/menaquinone biosynthesis C-methylase UbiE